MERLEQFAPCEGEGASASLACGESFIQDFGRRAFRRPLTDEEQARFSSFFSDRLESGSYKDAIQITAQAFLMSPQFLYRIEENEKLSHHEFASRLSYFLTNSAPDAALSQDADQGRLTNDAEKIASHAARLLDSELGHKMVAHFHDGWLRFDEMKETVRASESLEIGERLAGDLQESIEAYVDHVFWEGEGTVEALLSSTEAFINEDIAEIYGENAEGQALTRVQLDAQRRAGLTTQAAWLAQHSYPERDNPVARGYFVADRLLCVNVPDPEPGFEPEFPEEDLNAPPKSTREVLLTIHQEGECEDCHKFFDGYGFAFGHYDQVGKWRDVETIRGYDLEIDASGSFYATDYIQGDFDGAVDLAQQMAASEEVARCVTKQWFRYTHGREPSRREACIQEEAYQVLASGGSMRDMILKVATSPSFQYRSAL